ncbi:helix-turn-helix domain-containing protein [Bordetella sp. 02P26C-1]|uniref:helix-turn-helix domain-containing protein n=1 Tax=Bordetella sp. 02P26C-1 TaxID=2683195 RepID=UPI00135413E8|nr:helix-turn-helix domain-containing protein [Bordetella sp. 02P26C-1]MVW80211.1 helix-turn-helix domain-containing protein [Bordetella sp. 02P26C-1]
MSKHLTQAQPATPPGNTALLYRLKEAEDVLALSRTMIYRLIKRGELEQVKIGDATRITASSVRALIERGKQRKAA